jgi:uncharacterized repeat protein (TIGR02543 family)
VWLALACAVVVCALVSVAVAATSYVVTVRVHGSGVVTSVPAGIGSCTGTCASSFEESTQVALTATPNPGFVFVGWNGLCTSTATTCQFLVDSAHDVDATFAPAPAEVLTVHRRGLGQGVVTSDPAGIECGTTCSDGFLPDTVVTLTAVPAPGSVFTGWNGVCASTANNCAVLMDDAHDVGANFEPAPTQPLSVRSEGAGVVTSLPAGISCRTSCSHHFGEGAVVTLAAVPDAGSTFSGWGGACSGTGPCQIAMGAPHDASAHFQPLPAPPPPAPPRTTLIGASVDAKQRRLSFRFKADGESSGFQCSLRAPGKRPVFSPCRSPRIYRGLKPGRYLFAVRAVGPGGADPIPAKRALRIP